MKSPLRYQVTQYDCGPTTMTNAILYLFEREEIPPDLVRHIGLCTLDSYDRNGHCGMCGTTGAAMRYFGTWLNELRFAGLLPAESMYMEKEEVWFGPGSRLSETLRAGAAIVLHVFHEVGHYILVTQESGDLVFAFDPYYRGNEVRREGVRPVFDHPFSHNILLPRDVLNDTCRDFYSMGETETREALVIRREAVENLYFI